MLRYIKKISIFPISLLLLTVCTLALSIFRIGNSDNSKIILSSQTQNATDTILAEDFSSKIRPGDILLIRGNTWIDKVIQSVTGSSYTHVAGVVEPDKAIEILPFKKTRYQNLSIYNGRAEVFTCDNLTNEQRQKIVDHVVGELGTRYDYKLLLWEASRYLLNWVWPYKADDSNSNLCSTLWANAYRKAGVDLCPNLPYPSPGDLGISTILEKIDRY